MVTNGTYKAMIPIAGPALPMTIALLVHIISKRENIAVAKQSI